MIDMTSRRRALGVLFFTMGIPLHSWMAAASGQEKGGGRLSDLALSYPNVRMHVAEDGVVAIYGRPMSRGATSDKAASHFLKEFGAVLGAAEDQLQLEWKVSLGSGRGTVFSYRQVIGGVPVEWGMARVLVSPDAPYSVQYAAGRLVRSPAFFEPDQVAGEAARAGLRARVENLDLTRWFEPELVIYAGEPDRGRREPVRAWKISAMSERLDSPKAMTFFVSAATGRLLFARDEIYHGTPITGHISGLATPGLRPDTPANPPVETPLASLFVRESDGLIATTGLDGAFVLDGAGAQTTLRAELAGPWVDVRDMSHPPEIIKQPAIPPGPVHLLFNSTPNEFSTAHINAVLHTNLTHDFFKYYQPDFTELDRPVTANVNLSLLTCNAFFTPVGLSINFVVAGDGCVNTSYSSVVKHEYGHLVVNQLRLSQGAFGEGYSDTVSILMHDDPVVGRDFFGPGTFVRHIELANRQYPCSSEIHVCGMVIAGIWWDIKKNLQASLGPAEGLERTHQLFTDWSLITTGGRLRNSAHPGTPIEVLTVDDDDGDLLNGTPNQSEICTAFQAHNLPCSSTVDCGSVRLRTSCRRGSVSATVNSTPGTLITLVLDGQVAQEVETNRFGRANVRFANAGAGEHQVCVDGCENTCRTVSCD